MDELVKNRPGCPTGNQTLWGLGQVGACGSLCCLLVATATNYWLKTMERTYTSNGTAYYQVFYSGLWKKCNEETQGDDTPQYNCTYIDYFTYMDRDGLGPTDAIILSLRRATPFPMFSLVVMFVAQSTAVACYCKNSSKRNTVTVVLGSFYVAAGLMTLVGIIIYIGAITEEASSKSKAKDDDPAFVFKYGPSLVLAIASFVGCQLTGVVSINHFIALRHRANRHRKQREAYNAREEAAMRAGKAGNAKCEPGAHIYESALRRGVAKPYSLSPTNHLAAASNLLSSQQQHQQHQQQHSQQRNMRQFHQIDSARQFETFSPYSKFSWAKSSGGIRSETLYTMNGEASSLHRCPQTMAASSSPEADTSEEHREELAIKGLCLLGTKQPPELLLSCSSLYPPQSSVRVTPPTSFTKRHHTRFTSYLRDDDDENEAMYYQDSSRRNLQHRKQKRKRTKHELDQRIKTSLGQKNNSEERQTLEQEALKLDLSANSSGVTLSTEWYDVSSAENLLARCNKRVTLV